MPPSLLSRSAISKPDAAYFPAAANTTKNDREKKEKLSQNVYGNHRHPDSFQTNNLASLQPSCTFIVQSAFWGEKVLFKVPLRNQFLWSGQKCIPDGCGKRTSRPPFHSLRPV